MTLEIPAYLWTVIAGFLALGSLKLVISVLQDGIRFRAARRLDDYVTRVDCEKAHSQLIGEMTGKCAMCTAAVESRLAMGDAVFKGMKEFQDWARAAITLLLEKNNISLVEVDEQRRVQGIGR